MLLSSWPCSLAPCPPAPEVIRPLGLRHSGLLVSPLEGVTGRGVTPGWRRGRRRDPQAAHRLFPGVAASLPELLGGAAARSRRWRGDPQWPRRGAVGGAMAGCCSVLGSFLFEYDTPRIVLIRSRKVGLMNRAVQLLILAYVIG